MVSRSQQQRRLLLLLAVFSSCCQRAAAQIMSIWAIGLFEQDRDGDGQPDDVWPVIQSGLAYGLSTVSLFLIIASIVFMVVQPAGSCLCWATPFSDAPSCMGCFSWVFRVRSVNFLMVMVWAGVLVAQQLTVTTGRMFLYGLVVFGTLHLLTMVLVTVRLMSLWRRRDSFTLDGLDGAYRRAGQEQLGHGARTRPPLLQDIPMRTGELVVVIQPDFKSEVELAGVQHGGDDVAPVKDQGARGSTGITYAIRYDDVVERESECDVGGAAQRRPDPPPCGASPG